MIHLLLAHMWVKFFMFFLGVFLVGIAVVRISKQQLQRDPIKEPYLLNDPNILNYEQYKRKWEDALAGGWFLVIGGPICMLICIWGLTR